jgi:hypothetical protein
LSNIIGHYENSKPHLLVWKKRREKKEREVEIEMREGKGEEEGERNLKVIPVRM